MAGAAEQFEATAGDAPGERYDLLAVAARGFRPPQFLSVEPVAVDAAPADDAAPTETAAPDHEGLRQTWSLLYRQLVETTSRTTDPYAIYLLGVNPPPDATDAELEEFNRFYTEVHLPEVAERRHALRAVRYELAHELRPPYQGSPRFLAVYEVDEVSAADRRHVGPKYSAGPPVWQEHTTPWRLWYHRLPGAAPGE